jgi:hypothetical protein
MEKRLLGMSVALPLRDSSIVLLVFRAKEREEIERRLADDPWTRCGLLLTARISRWDLRIGAVA